MTMQPGHDATIEPTTATAAVLTVGRETFDVAHGADRAAAAFAVIGGLGVDVVGHRDLATQPDETARRVAAALDAEPDVIVVVQATFTDASAVIDLAERTATPVVVWSFPEARTGGNLRLNSLCGANLAAYSLRRRDHRCAFVHVDPDAPDAGRRVAAAIERVLDAPIDDDATVAAATVITGSARRAAAATAAAMRGSRVGVIGDAPTGFEPCLGDDEEIARRFGVVVDRLELADLFESATEAPTEQVVQVTQRIRSTMSLDEGMTPASIEPSARLYCSMRRHADDRGFAAFATRCWPECMVEFGGAACTPQAMMADDGVSGTCEADVLGAVTSVMLRSVAGAAPFVADLVDVDEADGTSVLWHCGVAPSEMAAPDAPVAGTVHPNRKVPLVNQFVLRPGRVTVARLSQCGGRPSLVLGTGEMLPRPRPFSGTSGVIRWDRPVDDVAATIFGRGVEHHLGVVYGDHREVLEALAADWGLPVVRLGVDR